MNAHEPLIITSYLGRNPHAVARLVQLSEYLSIPVYQSCPSTVNIPHSHPHFVDISFGIGTNTWLKTADVVLIIDSDIPYIPVHNKPRSDAQIFHIDVDVLKENMGMFHIDAMLRCKADAELALTQILQALPESTEMTDRLERDKRLRSNQISRLSNLNFAEDIFPADGSFTVPNILGVLRKAIPKSTLILNEGISNYPLVWNHMRPDVPGSMFSSGSSSLGWGLGAAIGASLGDKFTSRKFELIVLIVGDGSFLFGVPSSAYWIARRYNTVSRMISRSAI